MIILYNTNYIIDIEKSPLCIIGYFCKVKCIHNIGEIFTGMTFLECLCDIRWDHVLSFVPHRIVRSNSYVYPRIFDVVIMSVVVKWYAYGFIVRVHTKNLMMLCDYHQDRFQWVLICKTLMPHISVINKLQWEEIQLCEIILGTFIVFGQVEISRVDGWCRLSMGGHHGAQILAVLI